MSGVMIVDAEKLPETPKAFQQYVEEFFVKKKVLGKECYVASTVLSFNYPHNSHGKGIAPSHSVDLMRFKAGLKKDQSLSDWLYEKGNNGKYFWDFASSEPHDCGGCDDD